MRIFCDHWFRMAGIALLGCGSAVAEPPAKFVPPEYQILRTAGPLTIDGQINESSWEGAPAITDFVFPWWKAGRKEPTVAKLLWDDSNLYILCVCADRHITARVTERDGTVYQDDCFELMLAPNPERPEVYFNIEWNLLGGIVDNFRPNGPQQPRAPKWDASGMQVAGKCLGTPNDDSDLDERWITEVAIPLKNFVEHSVQIPPRANSSWNLNLNRHGGDTNPQFSQWSPGDTPKPSFHTPHRFGRVTFSAEVVPTGQARRHAFSPLEAVARMETLDGITVTPFAAEPNIRQPILVKCDDRGRLWVIQYLQYPNPAGLTRVKVDRWSRTVYDRIPEPPPRGPRGADKITICEDLDADGQADTFTDFVSGLNLSTGLALGHEGVFVLQVPYLLYYADRNRDDVPDGDPEVLLTGFGMEDAQSFANHLTWGPDGWLYGVNGSTTTCNIRGIEFQQGVWRYHPRTRKFELFCEGGGNLFGLTFDRQGQMFFTSNGGHLCMHGFQGAYYQKAFNKHGPLHNPHAYGFFADIPKSNPVVGGPCTSGTLYLSDALPQPLRGSFLCGDFLGHTCSWWELRPSAASFSAVRGGTLLAAHDPWFGATDLCVGPDGAVYISDFHDRRTAHPDPDAEWDRSTGRIYKLHGRQPSKRTIADVGKLTDQELLKLLEHPSGWYRERARVLLCGRQAPENVTALRQQVLTSPESDATLERLWTLFTLGGFDTSLAEKLLAHRDASVRAWTVRLLGELPEEAEKLSAQLRSLAEREPSAVVRAQLASTSQRLNGYIAIPILLALIERDLDSKDPHIPLLIWWGIESKALSDRAAIVDYFSTAKTTSALFGGILPRLTRRYASDGTTEGYAACTRLLDGLAPQLTDGVLEALNQGLAERSAVAGGIGQGELFRATSAPELPKQGPAPRPFEPVSVELGKRIEEHWKAAPTSVTRTRLAILSGVQGAYQQLVDRVRNHTSSKDDRLQSLDLLAEFGQEDCIDAVAALFASLEPEPIQLAALKVLQRFDQPAVHARFLSGYSTASPTVRTALVEILFSRSVTAELLLRQIDRGEIPAADIPLNQLRRAVQFESPAIAELVRKHWGQVRSATPEEKLAVMRRLNNDLRVEKGSEQAGRQLFQKHCATCHKLFEQGEKVGPDLTNSSRKDTEFVLASLVDPSAVVRREYAASTIATTTGQIMTGMVLADVNGKLTLVDHQGQRREISRADVAELRDSDVSLMPEGLPLLFSPQELRDLFSYLQSDPK